MKIITTVRINLTVDVTINSTAKIHFPLERINHEAVAAATREVDELISELGNVKRVPGQISVQHVTVGTEA